MIYMAHSICVRSNEISVLYFDRNHKFSALRSDKAHATVKESLALIN